jgi:hypothetical protein
MIAVRLQGRLGNQLFQYAFILSAAKELGTSFYIDQYIDRSFVDKYFQVKHDDIGLISLPLINIRGYKNLFSYHLRRNIYKSLASLLGLKKKDYPFEIEYSSVELQNTTLYTGYFQSCFFLKKHEDLIRQKLVLKKKFTHQFNTKFEQLYRNKTIVTVHIRRTDYLNLGQLSLGNADMTLPLTYYQNTLAELKQANVHFIFVSDDTAYVEKNFAGIEPKTISKDSEIMDFQHLLNADVCVISNSTFSWWGAWLNSKKDKVIYCPRYYLGYYLKKEIPTGIYPGDWKQIDY